MKSIRVILVLMLTQFALQNATAQKKDQLVRMAKLVIDSTQLEKYKVFLTEEIETSLRAEPGVLTLYAVSEKERPNYITILEIYKDIDAYKAHIQTAHFLKYKNGTLHMVKSLELIETHPLMPKMKLIQRD